MLANALHLNMLIKAGYFFMEDILLNLKCQNNEMHVENNFANKEIISIQELI